MPLRKELEKKPIFLPETKERELFKSLKDDFLAVAGNRLEHHFGFNDSMYGRGRKEILTKYLEDIADHHLGWFVRKGLDKHDEILDQPGVYDAIRDFVLGVPSRDRVHNDYINDAVQLEGGENIRELMQALGTDERNTANSKLAGFLSGRVNGLGKELMGGDLMEIPEFLEFTGKMSPDEVHSAVHLMAMGANAAEAYELVKGQAPPLAGVERALEAFQHTKNIVNDYIGMVSGQRPADARMRQSLIKTHYDGVAAIVERLGIDWAGATNDQKEEVADNLQSFFKLLSSKPEPQDVVSVIERQLPRRRDAAGNFIETPEQYKEFVEKMKDIVGEHAVVLEELGIEKKTYKEAKMGAMRRQSLQDSSLEARKGAANQLKEAGKIIAAGGFVAGFFYLLAAILGIPIL